MSVFISIASLEDPELSNTIHSAIDNADGDVHVGVALTTSFEYMCQMVKEFSYLRNISTYWNDPQHNTGVGQGRNYARDLYDGQDYFLQVDAHTNFEKSWDTFIIEVLHEAINQTNTDKTILTGLPARYKSEDGVREVIDKRTQYPRFVPNYYLHHDFPMLQWDASPLTEFPGKFARTDRIVPANKLTASFAFGTSKFAEYYGLPKESVFFDEEIIQSINLLGEGFCLAFPNMEIPIAHHYFSDIVNVRQARKTLGHVFQGDPIYPLWDHYVSFINNPDNLDKCEYFEKYSGYRLRSKIPAQYFVPKNYRLTD